MVSSQLQFLWAEQEDSTILRVVCLLGRTAEEQRQRREHRCEGRRKAWTRLSITRQSKLEKRTWREKMTVVTWSQRKTDTGRILQNTDLHWSVLICILRGYRTIGKSMGWYLFCSKTADSCPCFSFLF